MHPFGPFLFALFATIALAGLLPASRRARLADGIERRARWVGISFGSFVAAFCGYGFLRLLLQVTGLGQFGL